MKITKFVHSCLMVEMPAPVNRTVIFDPGVFSEAALDVDKLEFLDDIIITHIHPDHLSLILLKQLVDKFPEVRITSTLEVVEMLAGEGIDASADESEGIVFFESPHERVTGPLPQNIGVHYLDLLTNPGDSHSFSESKQVLLLPVTAPWGSTIAALDRAIEVKPKYVIPVHDWFWSDEARKWFYDSNIAPRLQSEGIELIKPATGEPFVLDLN